MLSRWQIIEKYKKMPIQLKAGFWFLVCTVLQRLISIITTPIYTRLLTTYEYGQYSVFVSWKGLLSCFVTLQISSAVYMQAIVKHEDERDKYASATEGLTLALIGSWIAIYLLFRNTWNEATGLDTPQMIAMFAIMWGNAVFGFWSTEQRVDYQYKALLALSLAMTFIQPILCVLCINCFEDKVTGLVWGIAIATTGLYSILFLNHMRRGKVFYSYDVWKYSLAFAIPLIPHYISSLVLSSSDRIMIRQLVGESEAGLYNLASIISICGTLINQAVLQSFSPWVYQKMKEYKFQDIARPAYNILILIGAINLMVVVFAPEILKIFAPPAYYEAIWVMPPIVLSVMFMFMYNLFSCFEFYYEKKYYVSTATMIGAGLNIILNYIFIRIFGYVAAGYTTLVCYIVFVVMHYCFMKRIAGEMLNGIAIYNSKVLIIASLLYLFLGMLAVSSYRYPVFRLSVILLIFFALYALKNKIMIYIKSVLNSKEEINQILS